MRALEFITEQDDARTVNLVIKSSESRPGLFRVIDRGSRDIIGNIRSTADLVRVIDPRRLPASAIVILIPPALRRQYPELVAQIARFAPAVSQQQGRPITVQDMNQSVTESPLPPDAVKVLQQYQQALKQPGLQISGPDDSLNFLAGKQYPQLKQQIQNLERLMALFVEFEKLADRVERSRRGLDRGTAADLEIIRNWPTPETDQEVSEFAQKLATGIAQLRSYIQQKRMIWR